MQRLKERPLISQEDQQESWIDRDYPTPGVFQKRAAIKGAPVLTVLSSTVQSNSVADPESISEKERLIRKRLILLDQPFAMFRPAIRKKLRAIDYRLDKLELAEYAKVSPYPKLRSELIQEVGDINTVLQECLRHLEQVVERAEKT